MHSSSSPELSRTPCTGRPIAYTGVTQSCHHERDINLLAFRVHRSIFISELRNTSVELALALLRLRIVFLRLVVLVNRDQNLQYGDLVHVNARQVDNKETVYTSFSIRMRSWYRATSRSS